MRIKPSGRSASEQGYAVVIGASTAGLLATGALSEYFEHVTIVENDRFRNKVEPRKGVPQNADVI